MTPLQPVLTADPIRRRVLASLDYASSPTAVEPSGASDQVVVWKAEPVVNVNSEKSHSMPQRVYDDDPPPSFLNRLNITAYRTLRYERDRVHRLQDDLAMIMANRDQLHSSLKQTVAERDWLASERPMLTQQREQIAAVQQAHDRLTQQHAEALQSLKQVTAERERLTVQHAQAQTALKLITTERENITDVAQQATLERDRLLRDMQQLVAQRDQMTRDLQQLTTQRDQMTRDMQQLVMQRDQMTRDMQQLTTQRDQLARDVQNLLTDRERLSHDLQKVIAERDTLAHDLAQTVGQRDTLSTHAEHTQRNFAQLSATVDHVRTLIQHLPRTLANIPAAAAAGTNRSNKSVDTLNRAYQISRGVHNPNTLIECWHLLLEHYGNDGDPNLETFDHLYRKSMIEGIPYWDVRVSARVASRVIQPATYLEIGTRRGWSLAQVFAEIPEVRAYVVDMWVPGYGGNQGSPEFVQNKMQAVVGSEHTPCIEFIAGNSHDVLPAFFADQLSLKQGPAPKEFDLITVDGDHALQGAWWDLYDLFPRVAVGGAMLFDDLDYIGDEKFLGVFTSSQHARPPMPAYVQSLGEVWQHMASLYPNFVFFNSLRLEHRCGIALRLF